MSLYLDLATIFAAAKEKKDSGKICTGERIGQCLYLVFNFHAFEMLITSFHLFSARDVGM